MFNAYKNPYNRKIMASSACFVLFTAAFGISRQYLDKGLKEIVPISLFLLSLASFFCIFYNISRCAKDELSHGDEKTNLIENGSYMERVLGKYKQDPFETNLSVVV